MSTEVSLTSLAECEQVIDNGLRHLTTVLEAVNAIKERELWREGGYDSFSDYLGKRWSGSYRRRISSALTAFKSITENRQLEVSPENERQIRPLVGKEPKVQQEAWDMAVEEAGGKTPTAKQVKDAVERVQAGTVPPHVDAALKDGSRVGVCLQIVNSLAGFERKAGIAAEEITKILEECASTVPNDVRERVLYRIRELEAFTKGFPWSHWHRELVELLESFQAIAPCCNDEGCERCNGRGYRFRR